MHWFTCNYTKLLGSDWFTEIVFEPDLGRDKSLFRSIELLLKRSLIGLGSEFEEGSMHMHNNLYTAETCIYLKCSEYTL